MKINLGFSTKRYTRDMSYDCNTTFGFGEVQPVMCQLMLPDSDINISTKQLVRLSPLVAPSFARVSLHTVARFVPVTEVYEPFESFLSNMPFAHGSTSFVPKVLPCISQNLLLLTLLPFCEWYYTGSSYAGSTAAEAKRLDAWLYNRFTKINHTPEQFTCFHLRPEYQTNIKAAAADYILELENYPDSGKSDGVLRLRLTNAGRRLRKIYIGLGYEVLSNSDLQKDMRVNILPLFAFYKAYFDTYAPTRDFSFLQTKCFALLDWLRSNPNPDFSATNAEYFIEEFTPFIMQELVDCYYSAYDDYISIHTSTPVVNPRGSDLSVVSNGAGEISSDNGRLPEAFPSDNILLRSLRIFSQFVAKDSVIGQRMSQWVRTHFNADISNQLFKETNFVGRNVLPLQINDVFSTSDTATGTGEDATGEHLGAYAGKGIGFGNTSFKYHSKVHGYLIVFACIVPESRTFQGTDATLLACDRFSLPQPEFDGLGYEITDKRVFFGSNDLYSIPPTNVAFGFVPRYTGFKYRKNICNGSMSLRSVSSSLSPYYLDRIIVNNYVSQPNGEVGVLQIRNNQLPTASTEWRYITKYPWLSNFNRIFIQDIAIDDALFSNPDRQLQEDNFIGQIVFNVSLKDALKPLKSSYDTFDEENDNNTSSVEAE